MSSEDPIVRLARLAWIRASNAERHAFVDVIAASERALAADYKTWTCSDVGHAKALLKDLDGALKTIASNERQLEREARDPNAPTLIYWCAQRRLLIVDCGGNEPRFAMVRKVVRTHINQNGLGHLLADERGRAKSVAQLVRQYGREVSATEFDRLAKRTRP